MKVNSIQNLGKELRPLGLKTHYNSHVDRANLNDCTFVDFEEMEREDWTSLGGT